MIACVKSEVKWGIEINRFNDHNFSLSLGISTEAWSDTEREVYIFINLIKWTIIIGKFAVEVD